MASTADRQRGRSHRGTTIAARNAWATLVVAAAVVLASTPAPATIVGGGGNDATGCPAIFDGAVNDPPTNPRNIRCTDGDSACDADGVVNGVCEFPLAVCA